MVYRLLCGCGATNYVRATGLDKFEWICTECGETSLTSPAALDDGSANLDPKASDALMSRAPTGAVIVTPTPLEV